MEIFFILLYSVFSPLSFFFFFFFSALLSLSLSLYFALSPSVSSQRLGGNGCGLVVVRRAPVLVNPPTSVASESAPSLATHRDRNPLLIPLQLQRKKRWYRLLLGIAGWVSSCEIVSGFVVDGGSRR